MRKLTQKEREWLADNACHNIGCYNYAQSGYIYCKRCLHGSDFLLSESESEMKKAWDKEKIASVQKTGIGVYDLSKYKD